MLPKLDELRALSLTHQPHVICIVESWLEESILDEEIWLENYVPIRLDRDRHGGGVLLYVLNRLSYSLVCSGPSDLELIILSIVTNSARVALGVFYRPPNSPTSIFDTLLCALCSYVDVSLFSNFVLLGDFNVNVFNPLSPMFNNLQTLLSSLCLVQIVSEPTRTTQTSCSTIDLVLMSSPSYLNSCTTIPPLSNSDHHGLSVLLSTGTPPPSQKPNSRRIWRYSLANFNLACEMLDSTDWDSIFSEDVNSSWQKWRARFLQIMELCIPQLLLKSKKNLPWLTKPVIQAIRRRNSLFRAAKRCKSSAAYQKYRAARNKVVALLRLNKNRFFKKLGTATPKEFWKAIKMLNKRVSSIPALDNNGVKVDSSRDKADLLNTYFFECFNKSVPPLDEHHPHLNPFYFPEELQCTEEDVFDLLAELDCSKSTGPDDISAKMLKGTATSITPSLTRLFNLSLTKGCFPDAWKLARVVPVPKSTHMLSPSNYRPISILSIISKILERIVYRMVFKHLCLSRPISSKQWGFLPGRSSTSALLSVTHDWLNHLDQGQDICSVYFDLRKAFDSVPHRPLLQKLVDIQLNPYIIQWVNSYLSNRSQLVVVEGTSSSILPVLSGVPQGSVLGPLLFLIFINDVVTQISPGSSLSLFADDMALYRPISSAGDLSVVQRDISSISTWVRVNFLSLQPTKCHAMMLTHRRVSQSVEAFRSLYLEGVPLPYVDSVKYLGILITSNLSWSQHISGLHLKVRRLLGMLYRKFYKNSTSSILLKLYITFIRPHLEYCSAVWDPYHVKDSELLEKTQKFGLKVCLKDWSSDYSSLLSKANIPSLSTRRSQARLTHMYKILHELSDFPDVPLDLRSFHYSSRSDNSMAITPYQCRSTQFLNSFFPRTASHWNSLPRSVVSASTLASFKHAIINVSY